MEDETGPSAMDVAVYARDIAQNLEAMTAQAGLVWLSVLFRACAWEAAEAMKHLPAEGGEAPPQKNAAADDAA